MICRLLRERLPHYRIKRSLYRKTLSFIARRTKNVFPLVRSCPRSSIQEEEGRGGIVKGGIRYSGIQAARQSGIQAYPVAGIATHSKAFPIGFINNSKAVLT